MGVKVSTIIPVFNSEKYLEECVNSVLNQTIGNIECILVDDGSTDSSAKICDSFAEKDNRVKVVHQKNSRIGAARNKGIDIAQGEFITFLDSDDTLEPNTYEIALKYMLCESVDIVEWDVQYFFDDDYSAAEYNKPQCSNSIVLNQSPQETMRYMYDLKSLNKEFNNIGLVTHCVWTKLYRKELFEGNLRFPVGKEYEDEFIVHRLMERAHRIITINKRLSHYRLRPTSTIHTMPIAGKFNKVEALEDRLKMVLESNDNDLKSLAVSDYLVCVVNFYLEAATQKNDEYKKKILEKAKIISLNRSFLNGKRKMVCVVFSTFPNLFAKIYSVYRKIKK